MKKIFFALLPLCFAGSEKLLSIYEGNGERTFPDLADTPPFDPNNPIKTWHRDVYLSARRLLREQQLELQQRKLAESKTPTKTNTISVTPRTMATEDSLIDINNNELTNEERIAIGHMKDMDVVLFGQEYHQTKAKL